MQFFDESKEGEEPSKILECVI